eukprot:COSAG04_NODE_23705_length_334_cov_0.582979_2_plen_47_part_01
MVNFTQGCGSLDCGEGGELVCGLASAECICRGLYVGEEGERHCGGSG